MALANSYSKQPAATDTPPARSKAAAKPRMGNTALQYQRSQIETASPTKLVIMLYEGAIRFCQIALDAMAAQDLAVQHENLLRAQRIIAELLGSLNREKGGEVAENLGRLYTHMLEQLVSANLYDQPEPVKSVQSMLRDLWASWVEVERQTEEGKAEENGKGEKETAMVSSGRPSAGNNTVHNSPAIAKPSRLGNINA